MPDTSHTPSPSARPTAQDLRRTAGARTSRAPLLHLQTQWQTRMHPRYLEAANFHWRR